jgi:hypothetical protein
MCKTHKVPPEIKVAKGNDKGLFVRQWRRKLNAEDEGEFVPKRIKRLVAVTRYD